MYGLLSVIKEFRDASDYFNFCPLRIINVQVTGTYKSSLYMYTLSYSAATYKLLVRKGFEIHLEQNHKTIANTPDMT